MVMLRRDIVETRAMPLFSRPSFSPFAAMADVTLTALPAMAHPGHGEAAGFLAGFTHPLGGIDHVLAMLGVGLFAARLGRRGTWALPAAFLAAMAGGAMAAALGVALPAEEPAITMTVVAMGMLVAAGTRLPLGWAATLVGVFAVFHGHAHGAEAVGSLAAFAGGFLLATGLLHASGMALGHALDRMGAPRAALARASGGGLTVLSGMLLAA